MVHDISIPRIPYTSYPIINKIVFFSNNYIMDGVSDVFIDKKCFAFRLLLSLLVQLYV